MAIPTFNSVGFCAHYSKQGDWAFYFALHLSLAHKLQLNIFYFLQDPYNPKDASMTGLSHSKLEKIAVAEEKKMRLYYDQRCGDYLNVGFRVCYDDSWKELHRCCMIREFQLLVLGYIKNDSIFIRKPIEEFANDFISPVILVGPDNPEQYHLNTRADLISHNLRLFD